MCLIPVHGQRVYPRVCGGTSCSRSRPVGLVGLSPRVRGNPDGWIAPSLFLGSIPACAGEPARHISSLSLYGVYPRVCGGTFDVVSNRPTPVGLSPRVRGNPNSDHLAICAAGSIPACAGEPSGRCRCPPTPAVYPRVCGGTENSNKDTIIAAGLSPRVRGNRRRIRQLDTRTGSIPACAGEPTTAIARTFWQGVYPRVCGGTAENRTARVAVEGLSPRVRGNLPGILESA